jgi:hypothetical protein
MAASSAPMALDQGKLRQWQWGEALSKRSAFGVEAGIRTSIGLGPRQMDGAPASVVATVK